MKTLVSGSTGLIGRALVRHLRDAGHEVTRLVRPGSPDSADGIEWDPANRLLDPNDVEGFDAVIHLAGESINQRWTDATKERILQSRVQGTELLAGTLVDLDDPPEVLVSASAVGYYGDRGDEWLPEDADVGDLFISDVCQQWEAASQAATENGVRVVNIRTGVVLSDEGGALPQMLPPFKLGLGGKLGSGDQFVPWVAREDVVEAIAFLLTHKELSGPVNVCAPNPVRNTELTDTLGDVLGRPTVFFVPRFGIRLLFGQMGEELLLASDRVRPAKLADAGFEWEYEELNPALEHALSD
jgi:uncharacterized protein (TIGR01777 family)